MIFDQASFEEICDGYQILDCTIGFDSRRLGYYLVETGDGKSIEGGWNSRFVAVNLDQPIESRFFVLTGNSLTSATLSSAWAPKQTEFLLVDMYAESWTYKPNQYNGSEPRIHFNGAGFGYPDVGEIGTTIRKVVRVGSTVYAIGFPYRIYEREDAQSWLEHKGIPIPKELKSKDEETITEAIGNCKFFDLAGFTNSDMYAVGGSGTVWHYDGSTWKNLPFPSNLRLHTVACAGDGYVYITDIRGSLWRGRNSEWKLLVKMDQSLPFIDSAWFNNRLWLANDYGMYILEGDHLVPAHLTKRDPVPMEVAIHSQRIDVTPDGSQMLVCGGLGSALHDGKTWTVLFSDLAFE